MGSTWREQIWAVIEEEEVQCAALHLSPEEREKRIRDACPYWVRQCSWQTKLWQEEMRRLFGRKRAQKEPPADPTRPFLPGM